MRLNSFQLCLKSQRLYPPLKRHPLLTVRSKHYLGDKRKDLGMSDLKSPKITKSDAQWREELTADQYRILREHGTERPFTGPYWNSTEKGLYRCAACDEPLFISDTKFDAGCGWPSYFEPVKPDAVIELRDTAHGMVRTEIRCATCDGHLGHVFPDGPPPTGLRYCINGHSMVFEPQE